MKAPNGLPENVAAYYIVDSTATACFAVAPIGCEPERLGIRMGKLRNDLSLKN